VADIQQVSSRPDHMCTYVYMYVIIFQIVFELH
jgi:hypothetical protein